MMYDVRVNREFYEKPWWLDSEEIFINLRNKRALSISNSFS